MNKKIVAVIAIVVLIFVISGISILVFLQLNNKPQNNPIVNTGTNIIETNTEIPVSYINSEAVVSVDSEVETLKAQNKFFALKNIDYTSGRIQNYVLYSKNYNSDLSFKDSSLEVFSLENGGSLLAKIDFPKSSISIPISYSFAPNKEVVLIFFTMIGTGCPQDLIGTECEDFMSELNNEYARNGGLWSYNFATKSFKQVVSPSQYKNEETFKFEWSGSDQIVVTTASGTIDVNVK